MTAKPDVAESFARAPVVGVVRTSSRDEAATVARAFIEGGLELIEITFTVPGAAELVRQLRSARKGSGPPWVGMGTVTSAARARAALEAGAEFVVTPNTKRPVAELVHDADVFLVVGALTPTEVVDAWDAGADLVKVFPLPPVGGPHYLSVVRGPLGDVPMLASGGFDVEEIPAYRDAGAVAFGIGAPLLGLTMEETGQRIRRALELARGPAAPEASA
ncbi:MAG: bifunctional 4-hydroxy-2-oxoglutarate aldolase/2-dehydro-3-deoxy-phosphogluconate aldolase [Thermoanaerobaculia bacterium]